MKRVMEDLTLLAQAELGDEVDAPTALDYVQFWLENGGTLIELATKLNESSAKDDRGKYDPQLEGGSIGRMLRRQFGEPACDAVLGRARARGATAHVERSHAIADEPVNSSEDASRARNRIGVRQWTASAYDKGQFGQKGAGVNVQVNLGVLHLDALRRRAIPQPEVRLLDEQTATTVDAEVIEQPAEVLSLDAPTT